MIPLATDTLEPQPRSRTFGLANWRGLASLIEREAKRGLQDYHYQILGPILSSLLYLAIFGIALHQANTPMPDLIGFVIPGLVIFAAFDKAYESAAGSLIFDKHLRMIEDILMAPLGAAERVLGYAFGNAAAGLAIGLCVALAAAFFAPNGPFAIDIFAPAALLYFAAMGVLMGALIGLVAGIWAQKWDHYTAIHTFLLLPLAFLSGLFYPIGILPPVAETLVRFNPLFYMIDGFRYGMSGTAAADPGLGAAILALCVLALGFLAYWRLKRSSRLRP